MSEETLALTVQQVEMLIVKTFGADGKVQTCKLVIRRDWSIMAHGCCITAVDYVLKSISDAMLHKHYMYLFETVNVFKILFFKSSSKHSGAEGFAW